jgi:hypothetical protein
MKRLLAATFLFAVACSAIAFQPRSGVWANLNESGSGYTIEIQEGVLVITIYSYQPGGAPQWYLASGAMTNGQHNFTGTLDKYGGGQCISCAYTGRPALVGNDGTISIFFSSETSATLTLPGGRTTQIQPFNFAIGDPPTGLLGEWVFFYDVGTTTFANRFDLTSLQPASSNGNGFAVDLVRSAGCELQISGAAAGFVICLVVDGMGNLQYGYAFHFGLDQTYDGLWISADGMTTYQMKGFKVRSRGGAVNSNEAGGTSAASNTDAPGAQRAALGVASAPELATEATMQTLVEAIRRVVPTP